ncbi:MAG TPA: SUMF1/EgtB/PvdO family nonheme iron enzyme [Anaerolineae bacterium]|nr:SUMF1/EgtB/PvdO family nonheme iron enzyme [Anaerolineae bacterium]HQK15511.1 SUMF1/EgtB/PvdO family nonheme iron enzyme [Anaerolineae bacterium]
MANLLSQLEQSITSSYNIDDLRALCIALEVDIHNMPETPLGLPSQLYNRLRHVLPDSESFGSEQAIHAIFIDARLSRWRDQLPEARTRLERFQVIVDFLYRQHTDAQENALGLFLRVLGEQLDSKDARQRQLFELADQIEQAEQQARKEAIARGIILWLGDKYQFERLLIYILESHPEAIAPLCTSTAPAKIKELSTRLYAEFPGWKGKPPFKGLCYFDVNDADLFFGREQLTADLVGRLREQRFLAVVGASGSGKSSLVRAGIVPALRRGMPLADGAQLPEDSTRWPIHIITPTAHPLEALATTLTRTVESVTATSTLIDDLKSDDRSLHLYVLKLLSQTTVSGDPRSNRLLLIVDQFEELFTACKDPEERHAFVGNLMYAVAPETKGQTVIIIALRADFYAHCAQFDTLREALERHQAYIGQMTQDELRRAIEEPARRNNWEFESGLVDLMLRDVGDEPGALPLLSHALLETWHRRENRMLTLAGYTEAGGVQGAIARTAETVYGGLTPEQQAIARNIFLCLTELGEGTQDTRRRVTLTELVPGGKRPDAIVDMLDTLADARLITVDNEVVEVAHEALIREWPQLRAWLEENRENLRIQRRLGEAAKEWKSLGKDEGALYRGARLVEAQEWALMHADELSDLEQEFMDASQALLARQTAEQKAQEQRELELTQQLLKEVTDRADREHELAEASNARAQAERKVAIRTRWLLAMAALWIVILSVVGIQLYVKLQAPKRLLKLAQGNAPVAKVAAATVRLGRAGEPRDSKNYLPSADYPLPAFTMDINEVTNQQYLRCVEANVCSLPNAPPSTYVSPAQALFPVVNVTALQAAQFCAWLGRRLPTEQEWERAARCTDGRWWPWGNDPITPTHDLANFYYWELSEFGEKRQTQAVGLTQQGVSCDGVFDLAGNVWEWTSTSYYTPTISWTDTSQDPPRVLSTKGGGGDSKIENIAYRVPKDAYFSDAFTGFRCVADP